MLSPNNHLYKHKTLRMALCIAVAAYMLHKNQSLIQRLLLRLRHIEVNDEQKGYFLKIISGYLAHGAFADFPDDKKINMMCILIGFYGSHLADLFLTEDANIDIFVVLGMDKFFFMPIIALGLLIMHEGYTDKKLESLVLGFIATSTYSFSLYISLEFSGQLNVVRREYDNILTHLNNLIVNPANHLSNRFLNAFNRHIEQNNDTTPAHNQNRHISEEGDNFRFARYDGSLRYSY